MASDLRVPVERVLSLFSDLGALPNPEDPDRPWGPLGPVVRDRFGPQPEPWRLAELDWMTLNPQPLPPKRLRLAGATALASAAVEQALAIDDLARNVPELGDTLGGASLRIVERFIDDCGNGRPPRIKLPRWWRWPPPPPPEPLELLAMAAVLATAATRLAEEEPDLAAALGKGAERLAEIGVQRA